MSSAIVSCNYICNSCGARRSVNLDKRVHQNRRDLKIQGLASYIDIHSNLDVPGADHGVRLFIDPNYQVRSNDPIRIKEVLRNKKGGIPSPKIRAIKKTFRTELFVCKSLKLVSKSHNMEIIVENNIEELNLKKSGIIDLASDFETVNLKIEYIESEMSAESVLHLIKWGKILLYWIEFTGRFQYNFIPPILKIIDQNFTRPPTVTDELYISILLDAHATIYALNTEIDLNSVIRGSVITFPAFDEKDSFREITGLDIEVLTSVSERLRSGEYIDLSVLNEEIEQTNPEELRDDARDSLVQLLVELIRVDAIGFSVSYLQ